MRHKLPPFVAGFGACLFCIAIGVFLFNYGWRGIPEPNRLQFENALSMIRDKKAREVKITGDSLELISNGGDRYETELDGTDSMHEQIYKAADGTATKVTLEQRSSGFLWSIFLNGRASLAIFGFLGAFTLLGFMVGRLTKQVEK
jgi:hypothetical protein